MRTEAIRLHDTAPEDSMRDHHAPESASEVPNFPASRGLTRWRQHLTNLRPTHPALARLAASFFIFGVINNALYVVILTAALELLPSGVPTGVVACANIAPALVAKALFPYILTGTVRYARRIWTCSIISFVGLVMIALTPSMVIRLSGIALASFSSGLGELTYLQLSTRYSHSGASGHGVGWFASGTGGAGFVGAMAWWIVRPLGVKKGLSILSPMPWGMILAYLLLLPSPEAIQAENAELLYTAVPTAEPLLHQEDEEDDVLGHSLSVPIAPDAGPTTYGTGRIYSPASGEAKRIKLSLADKFSLLKPMLPVYIIPLFLVYLAEYLINQAVSPVLLYPIPTPSEHPLLSHIYKKLADYYAFYQLCYQVFVFLSRSSVSVFHLPAIPREWLWAPAVGQCTLFVILSTEAVYHWFRTSIAPPLAIVLVAIEGLAGGYSYVSVFYHIGMSPPDVSTEEHTDAESEDAAQVRATQEHEFRIGCVGFGDTLGILMASVLSMAVQPALCDAQVARGYDLCKQV